MQGRLPTTMPARKSTRTTTRSSARRRKKAPPDPAPLLRDLRKQYPDADCALDHDGPFQLLAATILSAQCTDARVNMVTPELFRRWPDAASLADATQDEVESVVRTTGFFRNKAKNLRGMARSVTDDHGGEVPRVMEDLVALPGVARKTANVVLGTAYGLAEGVVVDTHVGRLSRRLGLTREKNPVKVERDLMELLPRQEW
ncbi:MAG: endonuclease III domain-containing protein, partial [Planctomycetota bacterium]